jgi:hypothetical protein
MIEIEKSLTRNVPETMGLRVQKFMADAGAFFVGMGGYPLPKPRLRELALDRAQA